MSLEESLVAVLGPLVGGRVHPDVTPDNVVFPCIVFQQVGGNSRWYLERTLPDYKNARLQINVWSTRRTEANQIARMVEKAICESGFPQAEAFGAFTALYEEAIKKYGTRQDFGVSYPDP